jgi:hypothetical protein
VVSTAAEACDSSVDGRVTISGGFVDPGVLDTRAVVIDWGDGTPLDAVVVDQAADSFGGSHAYAHGGIYSVSVVVTDDDGDSSAATVTTSVVQGVGLIDGTLYIIGTDGREHVKIKVNEKKDQLKVDVKLNQGGSDGGSDGGRDRIKDARIFAGLTMRSDFLGNCDAFHGLPQAINKSQYLPPMLTREELREVIELPLQVGQFEGSIDADVTTELLNAISDSQDLLPLMQHALLRMWTLAAPNSESHPQNSRRITRQTTSTIVG